MWVSITDLLYVAGGGFVLGVICAVIAMFILEHCITNGGGEC